MEQQKDYTLSILIDKSPEEVFKDLNNVRRWWQGEIHGQTEKPGDEFTYQMAGFHFSRQKIVQSIPEKKVVWLVTESEISFVDDKNEWLNTKIVFDISQEKDRTRLTFTHQGLVPELECYSACSGAWQMLIERSLLSYFKTGKGLDVF